MVRLLNGLIALMLLCALQLHLPLLQVAAWSGMLVSYSREAPLREAVEMTFDGEHPCPMCLAISEAWDEGPTEFLKSTVPPPFELGMLTPHPAHGLVLSVQERLTPMDRVPARRADAHPVPPCVSRLRTLTHSRWLVDAPAGEDPRPPPCGRGHAFAVGDLRYFG